jgi:hypothetical protein
MVTKTHRNRSRTPLSAIAALSVAGIASMSSGCGGGGGDAAAPAAQLAFTVNWERSPGAASVSEPAPGGAAAFPAPIPNSVNAIRFIFSPDAGESCCVAVLRGSQAFEERRIQLASVPEGPATLIVDGFPTDFAPAPAFTDGNTCATREPGGSPCTGDDTQLPSWRSDDIDLDVVPGVNVVDVDVHSVPFLLDLDPADGATVNESRPTISFTAVDANFDVDVENVRLQQDDLPAFAEILETDPCRDDDSELPDCSEGGALDVQGYFVTARPIEPLDDGATDLRIRLENTAATPRSAQSDTTFNVEIDVTTTTSSTSTTIETTTTTTLDEPATFCVRFRITNEVDLVGLSFTVGYDGEGEFTGAGEDVNCFTTLETNPNSTQAIFNDDEDASALSAAIISAETFSGPIAVAQCEFRQVPPLDLSGLSIQVTEATSPDLNSTNATVVVEETQCPL